MDGDVLVFEASLPLRRDNRLRRCQYEVRCSGKYNALTHDDNVRDALRFRLSNASGDSGSDNGDDIPDRPDSGRKSLWRCLMSKAG